MARRLILSFLILGLFGIPLAAQTIVPTPLFPQQTFYGVGQPAAK